MKTAVLIAMIVLADAAGDVFLTRGMKQVGEISTLNPRKLLNIGRKVVRNQSFLSGIFFERFGYRAVCSLGAISCLLAAGAMLFTYKTRDL